MKKIFAFLLMLALCLGLGVTANAANTPAEHKHALNGDAELTWRPITELSEITEPGNYYIDGGLTLEYYDRTITADGTVNLCLNGANVDYNYDITVAAGTTLNICDCGTSSIEFPIINKGTTSIYSGTFDRKIVNQGTLNIYNGSYNTEKDDAGIHNKSGTLTIYNGIFTNSYGHTVENDGDEIIIHDGNFEGNRCCVFNDAGTLTIHDGTFTSKGLYVTVDVDGGSATINGGNYTNGTYNVLRICNSGETLVVEDGTFTGSGDVACGSAGTFDIRGGTFTTTGTNKNVLLAHGKVKVSGGTFDGGNQTWIMRGVSGSFQLSGGTFKGGMRLNLESPTAGGPVLPESLVEGYAYYQNGQVYRFTEGVNRQIIKNGDVVVQQERFSYTVTYNPGEYGSGESASDTKTTGEDLTLPGEIFNRTGYKQTGWATEDGGEKVYNLGDKYTADAEVTLYPVWTINQYTFTFDTDGGSAIAPIAQDYNTEVTAPENPTKDGYAFVGWADETGNLVTFPMNMPLGGMKLKAIWELIPVHDLPKTGDNAQLGLWMMLMGFAGAALLVLRRREN